MTGVGERLARWNQQIDATGDVRALSVLRILLGPIVLLHLERTFRDAADGVVYSDRFYLPYADVVSRGRADPVPADALDRRRRSDRDVDRAA